MKNWKSLFIKTEDEENKVEAPASTQQFTFPVNTGGSTVQQPTSAETSNHYDQSTLNEVIAVYEKGIDSINMPGYDFYEFYKAISSISNANDQTYQMAFHMAKSMDSNITPDKLVGDAEFYISKINEVHNQYTTQGQQKINLLDTKKNEEKSKLQSDIEHATQQINSLRNQLQALEADINQKRTTLASVENKYHPQESAIRQKLLANDNAKQVSINKLTAVKEGIKRFIK